MLNFFLIRKYKEKNFIAKIQFFFWRKKTKFEEIAVDINLKIRPIVNFSRINIRKAYS